jgi:hypothetical protein
MFMAVAFFEWDFGVAREPIGPRANQYFNVAIAEFYEAHQELELSRENGVAHAELRPILQVCPSSKMDRPCNWPTLDSIFLRHRV